jgi:hypothetical protein
VLFDALTLDAPKRTSDGFLAVRARAAKSGVYAYSGSEVDPDNKHGLRDAASVNVLRDEATVFSPSSVRSFIGKPITDDHPSEAVTAANWRDHSRGIVMGAMRDGDHLAFDLVLMDAATIAKVEAGKVELSNGYSATLTHGDFTAADGTKCQFRQDAVVGNHCAIVDRGRAGPTCRIGDAAHCDTAPQSILDALTTTEKPMKTMTLDGFTVDLGNPETAVATATTLRDARDAARKQVADLEAAAVKDAAAIVTKDAEIAKLTGEKKALEDAKPTPAQLRDAAKSFAIVVAKGKSAGITVTDAMDEAAIMKAVVDKAMPGNTYAADHVAIAFQALTKDTKVTDANTVVPLGAPIVIGDAAQREQQAFDKANDFNAWRTAGKAA